MKDQISHLRYNIRNKIEDLNPYQVKNPIKVNKAHTGDLD